MKRQRDYNDRTPDLADRLAKDIAAALRLGLLFNVTSVPVREQHPMPPADVKVRYYFEVELAPDAVERVA